MPESTESPGIELAALERENQRLRDRLAVREEQFRLVCQAAFDGIMIHDGSQILEVNQQCAEMFGYTSIEAMIGRRILDFTAPEMHETVLHHVRNGLTGPFRSIGLRADGERMPIEVCGVTTESAHVRLVALRDLRDREQAEAKRAESEDRYRDLIENSHELICTHDLDGRFLSANPAVCRGSGYADEELLRMRVRDLLEPHVRGEYDRYIEQLLRDGMASGTMLVRTRDGKRRVWEYRNTLRTEGVARPVVRGLARDVTERDEARNAQRTSEKHFQSILENASDIIGIVRPDGTLGYHSPSLERVLGYASEEVSACSFLTLVHPDDAAVAQRFLAATERVELRLMHRNGTARSFDLVGCMLAASEHVTGIIFSARDITESVMLKAQLEQAARLTSLGRLAATVVHEFNNVLMSISPFAELLQRPNAGTQSIAKSASHISQAVTRGKRITMDILRYTQRSEPAIRPVELDDWWPAFEPELTALLGEDVDFRSDVTGSGMVVMADPTQLSQVLSNLVANARDAMPQGGTLTVRASHPGPGDSFPFGVVLHPEMFVHLSVEDTGTGIAPEIVAHIFEPLFTTKRSTGTGLGLAVAHQAVARSGGSIFVETEVGRGTTFHVFLPRGVAAPKQPPARTPRAVMRTRSVVLVEDEVPIIEGLSVLLSQLGITVHGVTRGAQASEAVKRTCPDLVVIDIGLPDVDGVSVYEHLRRANPMLPMIFATGHGDLHKIDRQVNDERTAFLQKPFALDAFIEAVARLEAIGVSAVA